MNPLEIMDEETFQIRVRTESPVTAVRTMPDTESAEKLLIYAPGAGSDINDPFGCYLSQRLVQAGFDSVRFQFPYMEAGKRRPHGFAVLKSSGRTREDVWSEAANCLLSWVETQV